MAQMILNEPNHIKTLCSGDLAERLVLDTSEGQTTYLLIGRNKSHIKLSSGAYHLLRSINSGLSFDALAENLSARQGRAVTADEVKAAYKHVTDRVEAIESRDEQTPVGFLFRLQILPEDIVNKISAPLSYAFHPAAAALLLGVILAAATLAVGHGLFADFSRYLSRPSSFWAGYGLFLVSLIFHEFGHASACAHYGARPSGIGFTTYLIYPAFYSDVSAAWRLKRHQRVVVDLGGVFFQLVVGSAYVFLYFVYGWDALKAAALMIVGNCLFSLNPIMKFDGYWVVADALGVVNLGHQPRRIFRYLLGRARGIAVKPLPWSGIVTTTLVCYSALSFTFWALFMVMVLPYFWRLLSLYPSQLGAVFGAAHTLSDVFRSPHLHPLFVSTYTLLILVFIIKSAFYPRLTALRARVLRSKLKSPQTRQVLQTAAGDAATIDGK